MRLASAIDRNEIRCRFFAACGEEFKHGASLQRLTQVSRQRGVWDGVEEELSIEGMQSRIRHWVRDAKDTDGRRKYHSLPRLGADGKEIPEYTETALLDLAGYKVLFAQYEESTRKMSHVYFDLINQCKERYGYKHKIPAAFKGLFDEMP